MLRSIFPASNEKNDLAQLHALFPQFEDGLLLAVLQEKKHKLEDAVNALADMCSNEKPQPPKAVVYAPHPRNPRACNRVPKRRNYNNRNKKRKQGSTQQVTVPSPNPFELLAQIDTDKKEVNDRELDEKVRLEDDDEPKSVDVDATIQFSQLVPVDKTVDASIPVEAVAVPSPVLDEQASNVSEIPLDRTVELDSVFVMIPREEKVEVVEIEEVVEVAAPPSSPVEKEEQLEEIKTEEEQPVVAVVVDQQPQQPCVGPSKQISVKIQSADGMRRIGINAEDPKAFEKIMTSVSHLTTAASAIPRYKDEEGDMVAVHSPAELEECIRVHQQILWPAAPQQPQLIRLYL